jgi:two-component system alkaline phosphatase synthesis response regulator PhoP
MKILVVDDLLPNLQAIEQELTKRGHQVVTAEDGQVALDLVSEGLEFDLLVTDQNMPRLSGSDLIQRLRKLGLKQPMLVLTSLPSSVPKDVGQTAVYDKRQFFQMLNDWSI